MRVAEEIARAHSRTTLVGGELLLSLVGTVGESAVVPESLAGWNVARAIAVIRPERVSSRWLQLCFESPKTIESIRGVLNTTVQATLNLSDLKQIPIPIPPEPVRLGIEEVVGALDDKIAANTKVIATANQLSHTVFLSMSRSGSQLIALSDTAKFVNGKAFTKNASETGRVVIRISELNSGISGSTVYNDIEVDEQHLARPGDLLFAWSGSLTLHRWFRPEGIVNQHIFKVIPNDGYPHWLVHELLRHKLEEFKSIAADKATTMGHIQRKHLDEPVAVPALEEIDEHEVLMTGLWERSLAAEVENLRLVAIRDAILPQLMSGKLRVKDVEKALETTGV
jgi:type I restriction enzyme S subunit